MDKIPAFFCIFFLLQVVLGWVKCMSRCGRDTYGGVERKQTTDYRSHRRRSQSVTSLFVCLFDIRNDMEVCYCTNGCKELLKCQLRQHPSFDTHLKPVNFTLTAILFIYLFIYPSINLLIHCSLKASKERKLSFTYWQDF